MTHRPGNRKGRPHRPRRDDAQEDLLAVGKLGAPHGLGGELRFVSFLETIDETVRLLDAAERLHFDFGPEGPSGWRALEQVRLHGGKLLIRLKGFPDRTAVESLPRGGVVRVDPAEARHGLEEGEFLAEDLVGCRVFDHEGEIGEVVEVESGPQDRLVVRPTREWWDRRDHVEKTEPRDFAIPFRDELVPEVDLAARRLRAVVPPGLEEL